MAEVLHQDGWFVDRAPGYEDVEDSSNHCVEVTYNNGNLGWEPIWEMRNWKSGDKDTSVIAWRRIRPAYVKSG